MRVQVNGRFLSHQLTGQQRYAREIVGRLADRMDIIRPKGSPKGTRGHLWEQFALPRRIAADLLWSPSTTGPLAVERQVVTIHDCAFFDEASCFSRRFAAWYQYLVPRLARKVRRIITVSQFSRERIIDRCRVPPEKISVIYSGVDPRFRPHASEEIAIVRQQLGLPSRYVLCVGSLEPRKNVARLLQAWQRVQPGLPDLSLVLVGATNHVFRDASMSEPPPATFLTGFVPDDLLPAVYAGAELFVYPSVYEGFGLPVIEAMASGVPVITSNISSLPEVAGGAALLVDPMNVNSIAEGIVTTVKASSAVREEMRSSGLRRASQFLWENTAEATWNVFVEVKD